MESYWYGVTRVKRLGLLILIMIPAILAGIITNNVAAKRGYKAGFLARYSDTYDAGHYTGFARGRKAGYNLAVSELELDQTDDQAITVPAYMQGDTRSMSPFEATRYFRHAFGFVPTHVQIGEDNTVLINERRVMPAELDFVIQRINTSDQEVGGLVSLAAYFRFPIRVGSQGVYAEIITGSPKAKKTEVNAFEAKQRSNPLPDHPTRENIFSLSN